MSYTRSRKQSVSLVRYRYRFIAVNTLSEEPHSKMSILSDGLSIQVLRENVCQLPVMMPWLKQRMTNHSIKHIGNSINTLQEDVIPVKCNTERFTLAACLPVGQGFKTLNQRAIDRLTATKFKHQKENYLQNPAR